jgi:hypothetical protein
MWNVHIFFPHHEPSAAINGFGLRRRYSPYCVDLKPAAKHIYHFFFMKKHFLLPLLAILACSATAQITMPQPSPAASFTQNVGLAEIKVEYSRPSAKGRKIMGEVVALNGDIWRTGANAATKFTTSDSLTILGKGLPKGTYILTTKPGKDSWDIIFNKNLASSATNLKPEDEVLRVGVKPTAYPVKMETFSIQVNNLTNTSATLDLLWENTLVSVPFTNAFEERVVAQIKQKLDGPTQNDYFNMSQFYFETGRSNAEALDFVNKALEKGERFWMLRHKSLVQARMGDRVGAIATAKRSLELSREAKNNDYVRMNEKSIEEWTK